MPESPNCWDRAAALLHVDGDSELLVELIGIWNHQSAGLLASIGEAIKQDDPPNVAEAAHCLRGSLQILQAHGVLERAATLEKLGRSGDLRPAAAEFAALEADISQLNQQLQHFLADAE